jgi:hypothetical protein
MADGEISEPRVLAKAVNAREIRPGDVLLNAGEKFAVLKRVIAAEPCATRRLFRRRPGVRFQCEELEWTEFDWPNSYGYNLGEYGAFTLDAQVLRVLPGRLGTE